VTRGAWTCFVVSVVGLVLAILVPDEPFHLSGVCLTVGVAAAAIGVIAGLAARFGSDDATGRRSARNPALLNAFILLGMAVYFYIDAMSEFSSG
jgi:hypothetical protein